MDAVLKKIGEIRLVPVVKIEDSRNEVPLGQALKYGNLPIAEFTYRTEGAEEAIRLLRAVLPEILIGAGTVLTLVQV
jgi:2-dehydro-3-deoxyphosphogluconate aldolase/(4S)-4-hydroxy-2-oxoglutarate aldolase